jgi:hypothetical protein
MLESSMRPAGIANKERREELRRVRMIYSIRDFQLALSAADFLSECDMKAKYNKVELRRYKCFETTMIIAYARPFSDSKGDIPKFSFKMIGLKLTPEERSLHQRLRSLRNKAIAHSDGEMMRFAAKPHEIDLGDGRTVVPVETIFDEGLAFVDFLECAKVMNLFKKIIHQLIKNIFSESNEKPALYQMKMDYLHHVSSDKEMEGTDNE